MKPLKILCARMYNKSQCATMSHNKLHQDKMDHNEAQCATVSHNKMGHNEAQRATASHNDETEWPTTNTANLNELKWTTTSHNEPPDAKWTTTMNYNETQEIIAPQKKQ